MRESPMELLARLKLGREEYVQRLLTMLIVDGAYPRWNHGSPISAKGAHFLGLLDALSFGEAADSRDGTFVDEFDLPRRADADAGGASDWAVVTHQRLWLVELKTEVGSHRHDQIPLYFELGAHHHPEHALDITYLTPTMSEQAVQTVDDQRFAHVTWEQVLPLVHAVWTGGGAWSSAAVETVTDVLGSLDTRWGEWRANRLGQAVSTGPSSPLGSAVELARETAGDGVQRALDLPPDDLEHYQQLRVGIRDVLARSADPALARVRPWLWSQTTSGGTAMTAGGLEIGYEIRLSRY